MIAGRSGPHRLIAVASILLAQGARAPDWFGAASVEDGLRLFPAAATIELLRQESVVIGNDGSQSITHRSVYYTRDGDGGDTSVGAVHAGHQRRCAGIHGWRVGADGKVESFEETVETAAATGELYTDARLITLMVPRVGPGVKHALETRWEDENGLCAAYETSLCSGSPVVDWECEVQLPRGWAVTAFWCDSTGAVRDAPPNATADGRFVWSRRGVRVPDTRERMCPGRVSLTPTLHIMYHDPSRGRQALDSWRRVSEWFQALSDEASDPRAPANASLQDWSGGGLGAEPSGSTRRIAEWVRDKVGYVQVYLGDGGYRPHPAGLVFDSRYGDCKDMSILAVALLRKGGVRAFPVLVNSARGRDTRVEFPSRGAFDHCVVGVEGPDGLAFFDPTAKSIPFGRLPASLEGAKALVIGAPHDSTLITLPESASATNWISYEVTLRPATSARFEGTVRESWTGHPAFRLRERLREMKPGDRDDLWQAPLAQAVPGTRIVGLMVAGLDRAEDTLRISYDVSIPRLGREVGDRLFLQPDLWTATEVEWFSPPARDHDIVTEYRGGIETWLAIELPPGWSVESTPERAEIATPFGQYLREYERDGTSLRYHRRSEIGVLRLPREQYEAARAWSRTRYDADRSPAVLSRVKM